MTRAWWNQTTIDFGALATAMLAAVKEQAKVEHTRHDELIVRDIKWAISSVERQANIDLHPATYRSRGTLLGVCGAPCYCPASGAMGYRLPFNNVRALRLFDASDVDVTGDWEAVQEKFGSNAEAYAVSPSGAGMPGDVVVELDVGVDDPDLLDPAVEAAVHKLASSHYENRGADEPVSVPGFDAELMQIWRPSA